MTGIDLNSDMGESYGAWQLGADEALMPLITSANIACGFHAGDPSIIEQTVRLALDHGVAVGAHPSYPDLSGFGRRSMQVAARELESLVLYQVAALAGIVHANGGTLSHVKLHGALYNDAAADPLLAEAAVRALLRYDNTLLLYALAGSEMARIARSFGLRVVEEAFADRRYNGNGTLQNRSVGGAVIVDQDEAADQAVQIVMAGQVRTDQGDIQLRAGTLCVHGDNPNAASIAREVRARLESSGIELRSPAGVGHSSGQPCQ